MKRFLIFTVVFVSLIFSSVYGAHNVPTDPFASAGPEAIPELIKTAELLGDENTELRKKAIRRLGQLKAKEAIPIIILALEGVYYQGGKAQDYEVQIVSARALAEIGDKEAVKPLSKAVYRRENNSTIKRAAVQALGLMGETARTKSTLNYLHMVLERTRDNGLAADISESLGKIGDKSSFVPLLRVTQGNYLNFVKEKAQKAIAKLKWDKDSVLDPPK